MKIRPYDTHGKALLIGLVLGICLVPHADHGTEFIRPMGAGIVVTMGGIEAWKVAGRTWGLAVLLLGWVSIALVSLTSMGDTPGGHIVPGMMLALSYILAAVAVVRAAFGRRMHGPQRIYYGIASYLLLGIAFSSVHQRVALIDHAAYRLGATGGDAERWSDFLWLSFSTLTTAGFGDVVPVSNAARMICTLEAVTGVMYPAIFLARLVTAATEDDERDEAVRGGKREGTHGA